MSFYERFQNPEWATWAIQKGVNEALLKHKALGVAIAVWKEPTGEVDDGRVTD